MLFFNNLIFTYISKEKPKQTEKKTYQLIRNSLTYLCMIIFGLRVFPKSELTNDQLCFFLKILEVMK